MSEFLLKLGVLSVDTDGMTTSLLRFRAARQRPVIELQTQHWRIVDGEFFRDCLVRLPDGTRRILGVRDDLLAGAA